MIRARLPSGKGSPCGSTSNLSFSPGAKPDDRGPAAPATNRPAHASPARGCRGRPTPCWQTRRTTRPAESRRPPAFVVPALAGVFRLKAALRTHRAPRPARAAPAASPPAGRKSASPRRRRSAGCAGGRPTRAVRIGLDPHRARLIGLDAQRAWLGDRSLADGDCPAPQPARPAAPGNPHSDLVFAGRVVNLPCRAQAACVAIATNATNTAIRVWPNGFLRQAPAGCQPAPPCGETKRPCGDRPDGRQTKCRRCSRTSLSDHRHSRGFFSATDAPNLAYTSPKRKRRNRLPALACASG